MRSRTFVSGTREDFVREVVSRLPLAELVLRLFDFVCHDNFLSDVFRRRQGRSYEETLPFPTTVRGSATHCLSMREAVA